MAGAATAAGAFAGPVRHVYVHVPFCRARCDYCDFPSSALPAAGAGALLDGYVRALAAEWEAERGACGVRRVETLYLGGGSPGVLGGARLRVVLDLFRPWLTPRAEVTVELNPDDVDGALVDSLRDWAGDGGGAAGRGRRGARARAGRPRLRLSLGVQSFLPRLREALGRRPRGDPEAAARRLRPAAASLGVDLIYGIPGQRPGDLDEELAAVARLGPDHVSWYELEVVPGTPLAARVAAAEGPPDADERAAMYRGLVRGLGRLGYRWYEVSSFARPGHRCRHNLAYWRARPYLGLGPGAVSTVGRRRWTNAADAAAWAAALAAGGRPPRREELLDDGALARERLMLAARCGERLPLAGLGAAVDAAAAAPLAERGLISLQGGTIRVTRKGRYVAGAVCVRLFRA